MRGLLIGVGVGLAIVGLAALGWLHWLDARVATSLQRRYDVPLTPIQRPTDSASVAEGARLAHIVGCHGCHGEQLQGKLFVDEPSVMRVVAPNVTALLPRYSDAELARLIRHGVRRDGTGVLAMPTASFFQLRDVDVARVIAYLRTVPAAAGTLAGNELRLPGKLAVLKGALLPAAATLDHTAPRRAEGAPTTDTTAVARGAYLTQVACTECHGPELRGALEAPPLAAANGYDADAFVALLLDGRPRDGRDLPTMAKTARERFVWFTKDEVAAIYTFLQSLGAGGGATARPAGAN